MLILSPGPGIAHPSVLKKAGLPLIHHRSEEFKTIYNSIVAQLKLLLHAPHGDVILMNGGGSIMMETTIMNLCKPKDKVLVINTGYFSQRFALMARMHDLEVIELTYPMQEHYRLDDVKEVLKQEADIKAIFVTHSETNSGTLQILEPLGGLCKGSDTLLIVDGVGGAIMNPLDFEKAHIDAYIMASQKGFMMSPGIGICMLSQKGVERCKSFKDKSYAFSFARMIEKFHDDAKINSTPSISLYRSLHEALCILNQHPSSEWNQYYKDIAAYVRKSLKQMGYTVLNKRHASASVIVFECLKNQKASLLQQQLEEEGIRIELGLNDTQDKVLRIGCMNAVTLDDMEHFLCVLSQLEHPSGL